MQNIPIETMKFSTELNDITYIIETISGQQTDAKYYFMLNQEERDELQKGGMKYFSILLKTESNDRQMEFIIQGVPLHTDSEKRLDDIEDFFENQCIFTKIEHHFELDTRTSNNTFWGDKPDE